MRKKHAIIVLILPVLVVSTAVFPQQTGRREATAPAQTYRDSTIGMEFVFVKGGCYRMGDAFGDGEDIEKPAHKVCVDNFYLGRYDVTVGAFRKFVGDTGYITEAERGVGCAVWTGSKWQYDKNKNWRKPGFAQNDRHPVVCVSWNDAVAFIEWLSRKSGKRYCLPSEAEWEYAARSRGKRYKYGWGSGTPSANVADESMKKAIPGLNAWNGYDDGYVYTSPVGRFRPNGLGLYDMTGNVWQWTADWYGEEYYRDGPRDNPKGPARGLFRVLRGGAWSNDPHASRVTYRNRRYQADRSAYFGFRLKAGCAAEGYFMARSLAMRDFE